MLSSNRSTQNASSSSLKNAIESIIFHFDHLHIISFLIDSNWWFHSRYLNGNSKYSNSCGLWIFYAHSSNVWTITNSSMSLRFDCQGSIRTNRRKHKYDYEHVFGLRNVIWSLFFFAIFYFIAMAPDETIHVQLSSQSMMQPKLLSKMSNDSSNDSITYYLSFTPELTCRYSSVSNKLVCFYHLSTSNLTQLEDEYDRFNDRKQQSSTRTQYYLKIFYTIIVILTVCTCILALYLLCCTEKLSGEHRIRLDYIVDPQLAREAALKLGPEPVWINMASDYYRFILFIISVIHFQKD